MRLNTAVCFFFMLASIYFAACKKETTTEPAAPPTTPIVKILSPSASSILQDSVIVQIDATDDKGVVKVEIYIDNQVPSGGVLLFAPYFYSWNTSSYADSSTHTLFAKAYDGDGNVTSTPVLTLVLFRFAPTNLTASISADTLVTLSWKDNSRKESGFEVERRIGTGDFALVKTVGPDATTAGVVGAYRTTDTVSFRVRAFTLAEKSRYSNEAKAVVTFAAPSGLAATLAVDTVLTLRWTDNSTFETGFEVERSTDGNDFQLVDSVGANVTAKLIAGAYLTNTTYYFRVRAKSTKNTSAYSNTASAKLSFPAPSALAASFVADTKLTLQWADNSAFETGFLIERGMDAANFVVIDSVGANITTKAILGTYLANTAYYFRIRAKSTYNLSGYSGTTSTMVSFPAPSNLTVISITATSADMRWNDNTGFETAFVIEQSTDGTNFRAVDSVGANITMRTVAGSFLNNATYSFRVKAKTDFNVSPYSLIGVSSPYAWRTMVAGGTFLMGSNSPDDNLASPPHSVTLGTYYIDKTEVTYEKWKLVSDWGLAHGYTDLVAGAPGNSADARSPNLPVTFVSWYDIVKWCNARSEKDGLTPVYYTNHSLSSVYRTGQLDVTTDAVKWTENGYRLPTEAEWEFAAKGGVKSQGYTYSGSNTVDDVAWYNLNSGTYNNYKTKSVSSKAANELGIFDMSGNVWEWVWDWYGTYQPLAQTDPRGPASGTNRIIRGGSSGMDYIQCRVTYRYGNNVTTGRSTMEGFRCVQR
jgi:formylglycine-generating enzyme required for sulfatase activity